MQESVQVVKRYSIAFKRKIVSEIENGTLTMAEARSLYDITGGNTIQCWIRKLGKAHLLNKVVRIEMKDELDKVKVLEAEKRKLESALAQAQLKIIALESTIKVLEEESGVVVKKSTGTVSSSSASSTQNSPEDALR